MRSRRAEAPLQIFAQQGYSCVGIEVSQAQVDRANEFMQHNGLRASICQGDMRRLPFENASFSFAYSYNTVFHMRKHEMAQAFAEVKRVVKAHGLIFINYLSVDDPDCGVGVRLGPGEYLTDDDDGEPIVHSYFEDEEAELGFEDCAVLHKEKRDVRFRIGDRAVRSVFLDYIVSVGL